MQVYAQYACLIFHRLHPMYLEKQISNRGQKYCLMMATGRKPKKKQLKAVSSPSKRSDIGKYMHYSMYKDSFTRDTLHTISFDKQQFPGQSKNAQVLARKLMNF